MLRTILFVVPTVWALKSLAYWEGFRLRAISATPLTCLVIGGAPLVLTGGVPLFLMGTPIALPSLLLILGSYALAVYLTMHYTGVKLIPNGLLMPLAVECFFGIALWLLLGSPIIPIG
jgi:hypothetical protein